MPHLTLLCDLWIGNPASNMLEFILELNLYRLSP